MPRRGEEHELVNLEAMGRAAQDPATPCRCGERLGMGDCARCRAARVRRNQPDERTLRTLARTRRNPPLTEGEAAFVSFAARVGDKR